MRALVFSIILALSPSLWASEDPLLCSLNSALPAGQVAIQVGVREFQRDYWAANSPGLVVNTPFYTMLTADGSAYETLYGYRFEADLMWQQSARNLFEASLPYYDEEFSPYQGSGTFGLASNLNDSFANKSDTYGDLSLGWRGLALGGTGSVWHVGAGLDLSVPTGLGPFSSPNPLVATGIGGFAVAGLVDAEAARGDWKGWIQIRVPYEFGYYAAIPPQTFVAYSPDGPVVLQGGRAWVNREFSYGATAGVGWDWYVSDTSRHRLSVEAQWADQGAMLLDGQPVLDSYNSELDIVPEVRFGFDKTLAINAGWLLPTMVENRTFSNIGEILVRLDYTL
jgi:hypothetical protein